MASRLRGDNLLFALPQTQTVEHDVFGKTTACVSPVAVCVLLSLSFGYASILSVADHVEAWLYMFASRKLLYGMFIAIFAVPRSTDSFLLGRLSLRP